MSQTKPFRALLLAGTALFALSGVAVAQTASDTSPKTHHRHHSAASTDSDRLDRLEHQIEAQSQEIQDLKAQLHQGSDQASNHVTPAQFQALQSQVAETQATVKTATANQGAVKFNHSHLTITSPDGKYSFSPIVDVMGDWASYSKGQPLPNGATNGKDRKSVV